ncbi:hypothetical protein [Pedobacter cryoconitis]|nr:hypothetical protein [Pedobacter cryoconitis]
MKEHFTDTGDMEDRIHYILLLELMDGLVEKLSEKCRMVFKYSREGSLSG